MGSTLTDVRNTKYYQNSDVGNQNSVRDVGHAKKR